MSHNGAPPQRRRVVIVGGGFGGMEAARTLKDADVDVTLIDRHNHLLFQPLIYQVAAGALSGGQVAAPQRHMLKRQRNATVLMATVTGVDIEQRQVVLDRGERIAYDSLIIACGGETSYFGHDEWSEATCALKTLADAIDLRTRIFGAYEEAERAEDPAARDEWLTFVVVGGGPTGVEISGQLAILSRHTMKRDFRRVDPRAARVILLDAGERVVAAFTEKTSATAARELSDLGVSVREHARVTDVDARGVTVRIGDRTERIGTRTVVWAAGVCTAPIAATVARAAGTETDRGGRAAVNPDLTLPGHPEISIIGDAAALAGPDGRPLPGLATVAIQEARHVARAIAGGAPGASTPFRYFDKGALAVVGWGKAVCEVRGHRLHGLPAFLMYIGVHLFYLGGVGGRRVTVAITALGSLFGARESRVMEGELAAVERPVVTGGVRS
ncbi:MAG TPA: NAD(P)/FAD-dependent oxidoreductase [Solirubrobacteraceae bacterium]|nr:NAD(P)/FAD-dependent oxidoreductase [Solirubrobacteraceae bacterium]